MSAALIKTKLGGRRRERVRISRSKEATYDTSCNSRAAAGETATRTLIVFCSMTLLFLAISEQGVATVKEARNTGGMSEIYALMERRARSEMKMSR